MPELLVEGNEEYPTFNPHGPDEHIFTMSKSALYLEIDRGCKVSGVKRIRVHDLRRSHVFLLIEMGFNPLNLADRMGHESVNITFSYAHLFPNAQAQIASALNEEKGF